MGGYGAMKIGINNPDRYAAIGCFSAGANGGKPVPNNSGMFDDQKWNMMNFTKYGRKDWRGTEEDTFYMAEKPKPDFFQGMEGNPYHYVYEEHEGIHGWDYWDEHITDKKKMRCVKCRN